MSQIVLGIFKIRNTLRILGQSENEVPDFLLSWSHYLILMRITNDAERNFYEIECANQHLGVDNCSDKWEVVFMSDWP